MEIKKSSFYNRFDGMETFYEGILTPEEEHNAIGMILFKPDAMESSLDLPIETFVRDQLVEMAGKPAELFAFMQIHITPNKAAELYNDQKHEAYLRYIQDHFETGPTGIVLVAAKDAPQSLNRIKGSVRTGQGVRGKFSRNKPISKETLRAWKNGELDQSTTRRIGMELFASNLIHVPDDKSDTIRAMGLLLPRDELVKLRSAVPFVNRWYSG